MNKWAELLIGLIIVTGTILLAWYSQFWPSILGKDFNFLHSAWIFLKGGLFWLVMMVGILLIVLGINDLRE